MAEGRRLRLHAVGIGGDDRIGLPLRDIQEGGAGLVQGLGEVEQPVALVELQHGRDDVLTAAAGMHPGGVRSGDGGDQRLDPQVVVGPLGPRPGGIRRDLIERAGDPRAEIARHDAGLYGHHQGGAVDGVDAGEAVVRLGAGRRGGEEGEEGRDQSAPHARAPGGRRLAPAGAFCPIRRVFTRHNANRVRGGPD